MSRALPVIVSEPSAIEPPVDSLESITVLPTNVIRRLEILIENAEYSLVPLATEHGLPCLQQPYLETSYIHLNYDDW